MCLGINCWLVGCYIIAGQKDALFNSTFDCICYSSPDLCLPEIFCKPFYKFYYKCKWKYCLHENMKVFFNLVVFTSSLQKKFDNNFLAYLDDCVNKSDSYLSRCHCTVELRRELNLSHKLVVFSSLLLLNLLDLFL